MRRATGIAHDGCEFSAQGGEAMRRGAIRKRVSQLRDGLTVFSLKQGVDPAFMPTSIKPLWPLYNEA
jgi:hypothetical protein